MLLVAPCHRTVIVIDISERQAPAIRTKLTALPKAKLPPLKSNSVLQRRNFNVKAFLNLHDRPNVIHSETR